MCKDIGLSYEIKTTATIDDVMMIEMEKRKRTFWAIYCYDVMMSAENGNLPYFNTISVPPIPHILPDEEQEKMIHFILLTKIMRNQSDIINHLHVKYNKKLDIQWNEEKMFNQLANELHETFKSLQLHNPMQQQTNHMCYTVCFLYLAFNFTAILLYRPYHQVVNSSNQRMVEAALNIKSITELILAYDAFEDMYCSIRGIQQIVHYLSSAVTVFKLVDLQKELKLTVELARKLASISPVTEVANDKQPLLTANDMLSIQQQSLLGLLLFDDNHTIQ
ncbi:MAG: hypothetical protein EXX96DRAFT_477644 [Benjaminiella poitrasii]|nr:MAG: hypothetical protein EXX96DRAFT_477644 [Benjaminiella poitrasii]